MSRLEGKVIITTGGTQGVGEAVGVTSPLLGSIFWFMTRCCGFLVLAPSVCSSADGLVRRWVDVFWTTSKKLRTLDPKKIRHVYFSVLAIYAVFGMTMLTLGAPETLLIVATMIFNFALGFSCWHTLVINLTLLPRELRPNWFIRIGLVCAGLFFFSLGMLSVLQQTGLLARLTG